MPIASSGKVRVSWRQEIKYAVEEGDKTNQASESARRQETEKRL